MSQLGIIQRIISRNKQEIQYLEAHIEQLRHEKCKADENGYVAEEYIYHNALTYYKAQLKKYVQEQKYLKAAVKGSMRGTV